LSRTDRIRLVLVLVLPALLAFPLAHAGDEPDPRAAALALEEEIARTIERVKPTVVAILIRRLDPATGRLRTGGGSGVFVSPDGFVLTNDHVAGDVQEIVVVAAGRRRMKAKLIGRDPAGDLALLKVPEAGPFPVPTFGDSDAVRVGQRVLAMGNPRGMAIDGEPVVTIGVVSALHCLGGSRTDGRYFYGDAIQTDAEINPGNSGGPLFDTAGRLLGINGRIATRVRVMSGAVNTNVGFSIPVNQIRRFLPHLRKGGEVRHGYLGVRVRAGAGGVEVLHVVEKSAAARAGLRCGDVLLALDGHPVKSALRVTNLVSTYPAGDRVALRLKRGGRTRIVIVPLDARPRAGAGSR